jgi:hypothetical protein
MAERGWVFFVLVLSSLAASMALGPADGLAALVRQSHQHSVFIGRNPSPFPFRIPAEPL